MTTLAVATRRRSFETRLADAIRWWESTRPGESTSSLTGTGAVEVVESWFSRRVDHATACTVASGTSALVAGLRACGIGPGSVVALPADHWAAPLAAVELLGAEPAWIDVGTNGVVTPDTVACHTAQPDVVVVTDLHGYPADVAGIRGVVGSAWIIEDCTQAIGARRTGVQAGAEADIAVWSLGHGKILDGEEGGVASARTEELGSRLAAATQHPMRLLSRGESPTPLAAIGRIHPAAALLTAHQLTVIEDRLAIARRDGASLADLAAAAGFAAPRNERDVEPSWHRVVTLSPAETRLDGLEIGPVVYPVAPPRLRGEPTPPMASRWASEGRVVRTRS